MGKETATWGGQGKLGQDAGSTRMGQRGAGDLNGGERIKGGRDGQGSSPRVEKSTMGGKRH